MLRRFPPILVSWYEWHRWSLSGHRDCREIVARSEVARIPRFEIVQLCLWCAGARLASLRRVGFFALHGSYHDF